MVERKVYKTKLCVLYQKGHCHRHSCNFAHGDAERRRFSGPFEGRRDYRGRDLREKLNRRYSPPRRYPLRRDISGRHASRGDSPSGSLEKSDRRRRKRQQPDGQSDLSESLQTSNETQDRLKEKKCVSYDSKHTLKIRQLQSEIKKLDDHKKGLEVYLEDRSLEAEKLALKVEELEMQLFKEKDECKRIASRIKKFIEAHKHLSRLHDEVKRSDAQLRKLGEKLFSSASASGDDLSMNIVTDGEAVGFPIIYGDMRKNMSPHKKRPRMNPEDVDVPGQGNPSGAYAETISLENNPSRRNVLQIQSSNYKKVKADIIRTNGFQDAEGEDRPVRGEDRSTNTTLVEKPKGIFEALPSTGMAAHAEDEDVEVVEIEEKHEMYENASVVVAGEAVFGVKNVTSLPPPPPLPIYKDSYSQLKGQDENVDIDGIDEEATEVDIV